MEGALWPFLGTLVGAAASIATTWLSNNHAISRQRTADSLQREERARAFQRDNLLEVQDALEKWIRLCARMLIEDQRAFREHSQWAKPILSEEVNEGFRIATARISILTERIADDRVRELVKRIRDEFAPYHVAKSPEEAQHAMDATAHAYVAGMEQIGELLRRLY